jgi:hypothetical protein
MTLRLLSRPLCVACIVALAGCAAEVARDDGSAIGAKSGGGVSGGGAFASPTRTTSASPEGQEGESDQDFQGVIDGWSYAGVSTDDDADASETGPIPVTSAEDACVEGLDLAGVDGHMEQISMDAFEFFTICVEDPLPGLSLVDCMEERVMEAHGLTGGCAGCFVDHIVCMVEHCVVECGTDPEEHDCACCLEEANCFLALTFCTGVPLDETQSCN